MCSANTAAGASREIADSGLMGRERLHLQTKRLRIFSDDGRGEEVRHVKNVLGSERLVQFAAVSCQRADAALFILIVEQNRHVTRGLLRASIVRQQRQRLLHWIAFERF